MATVSWRSYLPSGTSAINLGDNDIVNNFQAIGSALSDDHYFTPEAGSADRGLHTPNASRVSFGNRSGAPADARTSGRTGLMFMEEDDPGILFAHLSSQSMPVGGSRSVHADVARSNPNYFVLSAFTVTSNSSSSYGDNSITYTAAPIVIASVEDTSAAMAVVENVAAHEVMIQAYDDAGVADDTVTCHVMAFGQAAYGEGPAQA